MIATVRLTKVNRTEITPGNTIVTVSAVPLIKFIFSDAKEMGLKRETDGNPPSKSMIIRTTAVSINPPKLPDAMVEDSNIKAGTMQPNSQRQKNAENK